ncbi:nicotinate-nucleotide adenylyltransferase [Roseisolibacter sp. H3M3-2]|uniref:nicotinate-nucleotide adenylyltransferase n=1 Tax=Roseisolibacter sp. H3M3-2 TaxID=3031323 RepID=UPI0023DA422E|nr:nicotinate-nucleotide adenylyltransferase [Roseisolibacter sp. H3M3-2]MDF1503923.1 nicotinate-nucleotide adenylyltransferase [Roseisolibacter sp. H3M3-2]
MAARLGVLGGTFDPPHVGHLLIASDAVEQLALDRVVFVPAALQPLKPGSARTPSEHRLAMVRALVGDDPRFAVDPIEIDRGGLSYTVETLGTLAARMPGAELFLLVGADVLATFARWREPERIRQLATLVVLTRADAGGPDPAEAPPDFPGGPPRFLPTRRVDVSSTEVRARLAAGRSIRGFVPESVADLIGSAGLYR